MPSGAGGADSERSGEAERPRAAPTSAGVFEPDRAEISAEPRLERARRLAEVLNSKKKRYTDLFLYVMKVLELRALHSVCVSVSCPEAFKTSEYSKSVDHLRK